MYEKVVRPAADSGKISHKEDFELCFLRHQYLRRVEYNPTEQEMFPYMKIIEYLSKKTFYTYRYLFSVIGMEIEDIINIGRVHLVNFLGLFEINKDKDIDKYNKWIDEFGDQKKTFNQMPTKEQTLSKNKSILTLFLKQRMEDLVRICKQKARNIKGFKVDDIVPFYGLSEPPKELYKLLENHEAYGFKKSDLVEFKAIRKRVKPRPKDSEPFKWSMWWYVAVPMEHRSLTSLDLSGAGLDPYESFHNKDPETILLQKQDEIRFDKKKKVFNSKSKEDRASIISSFVEKNGQNPRLIEEIGIAKRILKNMGV